MPIIFAQQEEAAQKVQLNNDLTIQNQIEVQTSMEENIKEKQQKDSATNNEALVGPNEVTKVMEQLIEEQGQNEEKLIEMFVKKNDGQDETENDNKKTEE